MYLSYFYVRSTVPHEFRAFIIPFDQLSLAYMMASSSSILFDPQVPLMEIIDEYLGDSKECKKALQETCKQLRGLLNNNVNRFTLVEASWILSRFPTPRCKLEVFVVPRTLAPDLVLPSMNCVIADTHTRALFRDVRKVVIEPFMREDARTALLWMLNSLCPQIGCVVLYDQQYDRPYGTSNMDRLGDVVAMASMEHLRELRIIVTEDGYSVDRECCHLFSYMNDIKGLRSLTFAGVPSRHTALAFQRLGDCLDDLEEIFLQVDVDGVDCDDYEWVYMDDSSCWTKGHLRSMLLRCKALKRVELVLNSARGGGIRIDDIRSDDVWIKDDSHAHVFKIQ